MTENIKIIKFKSQYKQEFFNLNKAWLEEENFKIEQSDFDDLLNPEKNIIQRGGEIFLAKKKLEIIGTVALIPSFDKLELAKMTVKGKYRGLGISKKLMKKCLSFAKEKKIKEIFLVSNSKLSVAKKLYEKFKFKEIALDSTKYKRGNIKMILKI